MKLFTFYRHNLISEKFSLTIDELKEKYVAYLSKKEPSWIEYYGHQTVWAFVSSDDGLSSVYDDVKNELEDILMDVRHTYLKSLNVSR